MGDGVTEEDNPPEPRTYSDIFDEVFPHYLIMGMSPEEYWDGENSLTRAYREAYRIRTEREDRERDYHAWLQGIYIQKALGGMYLMVNGFVPKGVQAEPYPAEPLSVIAEREKQESDRQKREEEKRKQEEQKQQTAMAYFQAFVGKINGNIEKRTEREKKSQKMPR